MINRPTWQYFVHGDCSRDWHYGSNPGLRGIHEQDEEMTDEDIGLSASLVFMGTGWARIVSRTWARGVQVSIICKDSIDSWITRSTPFSQENSSSDSFR